MPIGTGTVAKLVKVGTPGRVIETSKVQQDIYPRLSAVDFLGKNSFVIPASCDLLKGFDSGTSPNFLASSALFLHQVSRDCFQRSNMASQASFHKSGWAGVRALGPWYLQRTPPNWCFPPEAPRSTLISGVWSTCARPAASHARCSCLQRNDDLFQILYGNT
jgi:hypothetical protein